MRKSRLPDTQLTMFEELPPIRAKAEPFLKWAGGKGQLVDQFEPLFPQNFNRYYEPFLGGGAVFFHLKPAKAVLNDINPNLIAAYRHIQTQVDELLIILHSLRQKYHAQSSQDQEQTYYELRARYNNLPTDSLEKSALLIFLNKTGYNGLYRESKKGGFNVPFGRYDNPAIFDESNLRAISHELQGVTLLNAGFQEAVETAGKGDFIYFDPPYVPLSKTASFTSYTSQDFSLDDQAKLAETLNEVTARGALFMLSNAATDTARDLYKNFNQREVLAGRAINSNPNLRGKIAELVVTNYGKLTAFNLTARFGGTATPLRTAHKQGYPGHHQTHNPNNKPDQAECIG
jgi:DNA adenine methylase